MELKKQLKDFDFDIMYEYPEESIISFDIIIRSNEFKKIWQLMKLKKQ